MKSAESDSGEADSGEAADASDESGAEDRPDGTVVDETDVAKQSAAGESSGDEFPTPPPASFDVLISMLFTQAMAMLGQMPDPASGEMMVNKPYAKHYIDTLDMLREKTQGNLSDDEKTMLSEALHALRMMYVNAKKT